MKSLFKYSLPIILAGFLAYCDTNANENPVDGSGTIRLAVNIPASAPIGAGNDIVGRIIYSDTDATLASQDGFLQYQNITGTTPNVVADALAADEILPLAFEAPLGTLTAGDYYMQLEVWEDTDGDGTYFEAGDDDIICRSQIINQAPPAAGATIVLALDVACGSATNGVITIEGNPGMVFWMGGMISLGATTAGTTGNEGEEAIQGKVDTAVCDGAIDYTIEILDSTATTTYQTVNLAGVAAAGDTGFFTEVVVPTGTAQVDIDVTATCAISGAIDFTTYEGGTGNDYAVTANEHYALDIITD